MGRLDSVDKDIWVAELSKTVGRAVSEWSKKNGISDNVYASVEKTRPSCYVDEHGVTHFGDLITVDIDIVDEEYDGD